MCFYNYFYSNITIEFLINVPQNPLIQTVMETERYICLCFSIFLLFSVFLIIVFIMITYSLFLQG